MKILIAEDDMVSRRLLQAILAKWDYEVVEACDGAEAWAALQAPGAPKLAILDWMMPGMDGIEVCRRVRQRGQEPYVYILLLTAKGKREEMVEGMEAGADDYLCKPFDGGELKVRLRAGRRIVELQEQLISAREAQRVLATYDALTGLLTRKAIFDTLHEELGRAGARRAPMGVLMFDIDHFKRVNDTYGHQAGDAVLRATAARMRQLVRGTDHVGRYGGEEFLVVAPGCDELATVTLAERLRAGIRAEPMEVPQGRIPVTASLGVACATVGATAGVGPGDFYDPEPLIRAADAALYRAKAAGRNRVESA